MRVDVGSVLHKIMHTHTIMEHVMNRLHVHRICLDTFSIKIGPCHMIVSMVTNTRTPTVGHSQFTSGAIAIYSWAAPIINMPNIF